MTQTPVRAVARVGVTTMAAATPTVTLPARRDPHETGSLVLRLMLVQVAIVGVLAVLARRGWWTTPVMAAAACVAAVSLARRRGRWWTEHAALVRQHRRRHNARRVDHADQRLSALRRLAPDLSVQDVEQQDGATVGVGRDGHGWFAAAVLDDTSARSLPLAAVARSLADSEQPGVIGQLVLHIVLAPTAEIDARQPCAASYHELQGRARAVPAQETRWLVVRLDARAVAQATVEDGRDESDRAPEVTVALLRRAARVAERAGVGGTLLDADGLLGALAQSWDLHATAAQAASAGERWRAWHSGGLAHASYWVRAWPELQGPTDTLSRLAAVPASFTSIALMLEPADGEFGVRCVVRAAAPPERLGHACAALKAAADKAGVRLIRLDGEQAPAAYASGPTGGGAR